ncbi:MAG: FlgD immunoglobulin-like domain containing protein [candidate division WOR-3 bacterium]
MAIILASLLTLDVPTTLIPPPFSHTLGFTRISSFYLNMYLGEGFRVDEPEGLCCAKMKEEEDTTTWRDDALLTLFAVNSGTGQIVYNVKLTKPGIFGSKGAGTGQFNRPHGIACNENGDVYVADTDNNRLVRLRYTGGELKWVGVVDSSLNHPYGVALDSKGRVYVTDTDNDRIVVYDQNNTKIAVYQPGLEKPTGVAILDNEAPFNDIGLDLLMVVDRSGTRINQLSLSGEILRSIDCRRIGLDTANFNYCAFDRYGNLYVTDRLNCTIHIFDPGLKYIISFGREAKGSGDQPVFNSPRGIAIGRKFGQLFVSEADGGQYYLIALDGFLIGCFPKEFDSIQPGTTIAIYLTQRAEILIDILNERNEPVRTLTPPYQQGPGEVLIVWDGRDNQGKLVPQGEYSIKVTIRPTYSRPRYTLKKELVTRVTRLPG